jgi:hypothetical protein
MLTFQAQRSSSHSAHEAVCVVISPTSSEVGQFLSKVSMNCTSGVRWAKPIIRALINRASQVSLADALNCAETLLEFLEQEIDSNFSDILTLHKLHTSIKLKRSKT